MKTFLIKSFCKINLSLRVIKKLHAKLHKIQSIVTFANLFDIIKIEEINSLIKESLPDAMVEIKDLVGDRDKYDEPVIYY